MLNLLICLILNQIKLNNLYDWYSIIVVMHTKGFGQIEGGDAGDRDCIVMVHIMMEMV